jgi:hypothetical protein
MDISAAALTGRTEVPQVLLFDTNVARTSSSQTFQCDYCKSQTLRGVSAKSMIDVSRFIHDSRIL